MPDWKKPSTYPSLKPKDKRGWAWEFLRRNDKYRADYALALTASASEKKLAKHLYRVAGGEPTKWKFGRRWGIEGPIQNPTRDDAPLFLDFPVVPKLDELQEWLDPDARSARQVSDKLVVLIFDPGQSIQHQLTAAKRLLSFNKKSPNQGKPRHKGATKNWATYLRLLDAVEAKAKPSEIAKNIAPYMNKSNEAADGYGQTKKVSADIDAAKILCQEALQILL